MKYSNYINSRDLAWRLLIKHNICELPVKVSKICRAEGIKIFSYKDAKEILKQLGLENKCSENDGFTFSGTIYYNSDCTVQRQRFTVAHELGHIMLNHVGKYELANREVSSKDNPIEQAANVFASRLLAPACVLWGCGIERAEDIAKKCDISIPAAKIRMERLNKLYERNKVFLETRGKSCFLMSPLERDVYEQFRDYINRNKV